MKDNFCFIVVVLLVAGANEILGNLNEVKNKTQIHSDESKIQGRLLTPTEGCGLTKVKNARIIGGSDAPVGAYPWIVILGYNNSKLNLTIFDCDGSLITSRHVLTAAHCILSNLTFVRLGEHDLRTTDDGPHQDIPIARSVKHPRYDPNFYHNDIGMLHLKRDVVFSDRIRPICLPIDEPLRSRDFADSNAFVAGWGGMFETGWKARKLQHLQIPVVDTQTCRDLHKRIRAANVDIMINDHVICAGGFRRKGFWKGDSGGPLMLPIHQNGSFPFYQIGIVSWSYGCALENIPGVYSKVQYYVDWIKEQLRNSTVNATKTVE